MKPTAMKLDVALDRKAVVTEYAEKLVISGVASNWDLDRHGERMSPQAFDESLARYLRTNPILLYAHKPSAPMGVVTSAVVRPDGLHITAELPKPEPGTEAAQIYRLVKAGIIRMFSVGGYAKRAVIGGIQTITGWDLREISIAPIGVNPGALFRVSEQISTGKAFGDPDPLANAADALADLNRDLAMLQLRLERRDIGRRVAAL